MKKDKNRIYHIYALIDPTTGYVRYIGITMRTLQQRLNEHLLPGELKRKRGAKSKWIKELLAKNEKPSIVNLSDVYEPHAKKMERQTIMLFDWLYGDLTNSWNARNY